MASDPHDETDIVRAWRQQLDKLGPDVVRINLMTDRINLGRDAKFILIKHQGKYPSRGFVEDWLAEQGRAHRRTETRRFWIIVAVGIAGIIVTIAVVVIGRSI